MRSRRPPETHFPATPHRQARRPGLRNRSGAFVVVGLEHRRGVKANPRPALLHAEQDRRMRMLARQPARLIAFWWGQGLAYQAPALAFYILVSLAPLALGLAAITGLIFGEDLPAERVIVEFADLFPLAVRDDIVSLAASVAAQGPQLLALSVVTMLWSTSAAIGVIERTMIALMSATPFPLVWGRVRLVFLGALFAATIIGSTALVTLATGILDLGAGVLVPLNVLGTGLVCGLIYRLAPSERPSWRRCLYGALPAAATLIATPQLVGYYLQLVGDRLSPASIFFGLAILLASSMLIAIGLIAGAGLAAAGRRPSA